MNQILVDSKVIFDVLTEDDDWFEWSGQRLEECAARGRLCIDPLICSEVCIGFERIEEFAHARRKTISDILSALRTDLSGRLTFTLGMT